MRGNSFVINRLLIVCAEHCLKMNDVVLSKSELDCLKNCKGKTQTLTKVTKEILEKHGLAGKAL